MPNLDKCLTPECGKSRFASGKGLCMQCYSAAKKLVDAGKTTWEELAEMGLVATSSESKFLKAFNNHKREDK